MHQVRFDTWVKEFGPVIREVRESKDEPQFSTSSDIEEAIRNHEPVNPELDGIIESWDKIDSSWPSIINGIFTHGGAKRYLHLLQKFEEAKSNVEKSAEELDEWIDILANTSIKSDYLIIIKKKIKENGIVILPALVLLLIFYL